MINIAIRLKTKIGLNKKVPFLNLVSELIIVLLLLTNCLLFIVASL